MPNSAPGLDEVVGTAVLVLDAFIKSVKNEIPEVKVVYDEKLSYDTAVEVFRAGNSTTGENTAMYPLFAFRRTVLRIAETASPGRRMSGVQVRRDLDELGQAGASELYKVLHGEFDIEFLFITKSAKQLERFEVLYLCEEGISANKEIEVPLPEMDASLLYFATYPELDDKQFESDSIYYKMIQGKVTVRGFYPVLRGQSKRIKQISLRIQDFLKQVYVEKTIT